MWSKISGWVMAATAVVVLGGCASMQTQFAQEAELVAKRGQPTRVWDNPDGTRTYEYSTQPNGESTWMYTVDATGKIIEQHDALAEANLAKVRNGMSKDEVQRLLGEHRSVTHFRRMDEEVWDWNIRAEHGVLATMFNVHFTNDVVARTSITHVYYGGPDGGGDISWFGHPFGARWAVGFGHGLGMGWGYPSASWHYGWHRW